jgi:hypothetical protein
MIFAPPPIEAGDIFFRVIHLSRQFSSSIQLLPIEKLAVLSSYDAPATETGRLTTAKASLSENTT